MVIYKSKKSENATEKIFNYKRKELIGKKFLEFIKFPSNHRFILEDVHQQLTKGKILPPVKIQCFTKEGRAIWVKIVNKFIRLRFDESLILVDITLINKIKRYYLNLKLKDKER